MPSGPTKPIIFISYAHADEPEKSNVQWLSFVMKYLRPAVKHGDFEVWTDREMEGGAKWEEKIELNIRACDIFVLLVSPNSMSSNYIIDKEIRIARERLDAGDDLHVYPLVLEPTPDAGLDRVRDFNLRPRDGRPFSGFSSHRRMEHMNAAANEIGKIAAAIAERKGASAPSASAAPSKATVRAPAFVHISGLPETFYERLVGRDAELKRLDEAWSDEKTNILSLVAEGGAGKSALVNEWLTRLQADRYRGADCVLGWSFYSQGSKERATAADEFLDWAPARLGVKVESTSASAKGEAIAEALMTRCALLVLDGVEPLQHGPGPQAGQLKDQGLRALSRRFAAAAPAEAHGLIVLTSRLAVADIARWKDCAAPVVDVEQLSVEAGAALLGDNGVWGTNKQMKDAAHDFGGHPLALALVAGYLKETQTGDVRRRDRIRASPLLADDENPGHNHARRVMDFYEREWLAAQPALLAIMHMVGLFDRPASGDCLKALRARPMIAGLEPIFYLSEDRWRRAVARLREVRLLAPIDPAAPEALDAHPLVREWFGERLREENELAWKAAHNRLYDHLRDTTNERKTPSLADLAPLYQAITHGCRAGRQQEALERIYKNRICRRRPDGQLEFYSSKKLGAAASDLAAISWFFDAPYETPVAPLNSADRSWVLGMASNCLRSQGRIEEALPAMRAALRMDVESRAWRKAATQAANLSQIELLVGEVAAAATNVEQSVDYADRSRDEFQMIVLRAAHADALHAAGQREQAERLFSDAELRQQKRQPQAPLLYCRQGYLYCDLLLSKGEYSTARDRATRTLEWVKRLKWLLDIALDTLTLGRANLALVVEYDAERSAGTSRETARSAGASFDQAVEGLRAAGSNDHLPRGLLARAAFRRGVGDWDGALRDLDEVEEIAEPGPMRLYLCDRALERARLALARREAFAPLNGLVGPSPRPAALPDAADAARLLAEARKELDAARKLIADCGYHRRNAELAELDAVAAGRRRFADLPPRV